MTPTRAQALARTAYVFTFPLVMHYRDMYRQAIALSSSGGGFGTWRHLGAEQLGGGPLAGRGEDALLSSLWLDLRSEPWSCTVPATPSGVSFTSQWIDLWGFLLDEALSPSNVNDGVSVLAASPTWVGDVPDAIDRVVRGESEFVALVTEIRRTDRDADADLEPIHDGIVLEPLSARLGRPLPAPAPAVRWWPWQDGVETSEEFWSCANFALSFTTPSPQDRLVLDRIAEIGVVAGRPWDASVVPDDIADAIGSGMDEALSDLMEAAAESVAPTSRRRIRAEMDRDYFGRALDALRSATRGDL